MSKNLFAFVTFGLPEFSKLAIQSIRNTVKNDYDIFAVVGKPGDIWTLDLLNQEGIANKVHLENLGFPASVNDIFDYAWKDNDYDNLILLGNDVILYEHCADSLINLANSSDYEVISALQYDVRDLINDFPEVSKYFKGDRLIIDDFSGKPWEKFTNYSSVQELADMQLFDIQNMCLYKRSAFDKVGYTDVNYYPAYYVDNDYANRMVRANIKCCTLKNARFFHFWSRVFKQGSGGSTDYYHQSNERYYKQKWGGDIGKETKNPPIKISNRNDEQKIITKWRYYGEMRR